MSSNENSPEVTRESCADLAAAEQQLLQQRAAAAQQQGVRVRDPNTLYIRGTLVCGVGVEIDANVILEGAVVLGDDVKVGAHSIVRDSTIGDQTCIHPFSLVEGARIGSGGFVGPYGRIRPGSVLGDEVQIGNFVEIKGSAIGSGSRINHHAFVGDAKLAERVTIGAGTITCNHDGVGRNETVIGEGAYIGSGCQLVAPVSIGWGATIGAGSTITQDVPPNQLTIARARQTTIADWRGPRRGSE